MKWYTSLLQSGPMPELAALERPRILIIEDDLCLQTALTRLIREIAPASEIDWATTAEEVHSDIRSERLKLDARYHLVISDVRLPGALTGLELWDFCRTRAQRVPFLMISGMATQEYLNCIRGNKAPPPFLAKPFTLPELRSRVRDLLARRSEAA